VASNAAVLGALKVILGADTSALDKSLSGSESRISAFGNAVSKAGVAAAAAFGAAGLAIGVAIKHAIDGADNLGKSAQKIGIPVEQLSALKFAAELSDVSMQSLEKSVGKLSKAMVDAAANSTGESAKAFKALGISVRDSDGQLKSSTAIMTEVAGKFENMNDGAAKTAMAIKLFGKSGAEMIPMLNLGKEGLAGMITEAEQLGIVIDTKTSKAAEAFNDNLKRLSAVKAGIIQQVTAQMLPAFLQMTQVLVDTAKSGDFIKTMAESMTTGLRYVVQVVVETVTVFQRLGAELSALGGVVKAFGNWEQMKAAWAAFNAEGQKTATTFSSMNQIVTKFWQNSAATAEAAAPVTKKKFGDIDQAALSAKNALDAFINSQLKSIAGQNAEVMSTDLLIGAKERAKVTEQAYAIAKAETIKVTAALKTKIDALAAATELMTQKVKGAHLVQEAKEPHEKYRQEIANNEVALQAFGATTEQIAAVQQKTAEKFGFAWNQVAGSVAGSVADMGNAFSKESKSMALTAKLAGIAQATIAIAVGAAEAYKLGFPLGIAASFAVLAKGAALIASIKSVSTTGFKTGGSIRVPGGMGGGDRMVMPLALEPGEQVDIWRPGEAGGDPRRGAGDGRTVVVQVQGEVFGQKTIRKLIEGINEALDNGARIKMTTA